MRITVRFSGLAVFLIGLAVLAWWGYERYFPSLKTEQTTQVFNTTAPIIMRTPGGALEVAALKTTELFTRTDSKEFWGIALGDTISQIKVPAFYRYHIELGKEIPVTLWNRSYYVVQVSELKPTLPVAIDTAQIEKYTANGWARFNKSENLQALEQSISPLLTERAKTEHYYRQAREISRETIQEFVRKWLLNERDWRESSSLPVVVLFPDESLEDALHSVNAKRQIHTIKPPLRNHLE